VVDEGGCGGGGVGVEGVFLHAEKPTSKNTSQQREMAKAC
jgi:hypothetical protein